MLVNVRPRQKSGDVRMRMLGTDCLFVPLNGTIVSTPEAMVACVNTLVNHRFIPLIDTYLPTELIATAIGPAPIVAADARNDLRAVGYAIELGFDAIMFGWDNPDDIRVFAKACREANVYGIIRFVDPGALELFFEIESPTALAAHLAPKNFEVLSDYVAEYQKCVESDSRIVVVDSTVANGFEWQRMIRHGHGRGRGFGLLPGLVFSDVFDGVAPNDTEAIKSAIAGARRRFVPYSGFEPAG